MGKVKFDPKRTKGIENIEDLKKNKWKLSTNGSCDQYRYAVAKKTITSGNYYFEVKLLETGGCYSAVGFCTEKTFKDTNHSQRLGK